MDYIPAAGHELLRQGRRVMVLKHEGGGCRYLGSDNRCTIYGARPLGCRIYHCDTAFQEELHRLSERFIDRLKKLTTKHNIGWNYAPLHRHLHEQERQGNFPPVNAHATIENLASKPS